MSVFGGQSEILVDALPYIDQGYDEPGIREAALSMVEEETKRYRPTKNYLEVLPPLDMESFVTDTMKSEYERLSAKLPSEQMSMKRYELPHPPAGKMTDIAAWTECVENSLAQLEHQSTRICNLELMLGYSCESWKLYNEVLQNMVNSCSSHLQNIKDVQEINWQRKAQQTSAGEELKNLESAWVGLVGKNYEIEQACVDLEHQITAAEAAREKKMKKQEAKLRKEKKARKHEEKKDKKKRMKESVEQEAMSKGERAIMAFEADLQELDDWNKMKMEERDVDERMHGRRVDHKPVDFDQRREGFERRRIEQRQEPQRKMDTDHRRTEQEHPMDQDHRRVEHRAESEHAQMVQGPEQPQHRVDENVKRMDHDERLQRREGAHRVFTEKRKPTEDMFRSDEDDDMDERKSEQPPEERKQRSDKDECSGRKHKHRSKQAGGGDEVRSKRRHYSGSSDDMDLGSDDGHSD